MMYRPNFYESTCLRCNEIVYQVDRVGPLKDFTFFHSGCFKCVSCGTKLTLKTYYNNQHKQEDKEVGHSLSLYTIFSSNIIFFLFRIEKIITIYFVCNSCFIVSRCADVPKAMQLSLFIFYSKHKKYSQIKMILFVEITSNNDSLK